MVGLLVMALTAGEAAGACPSAWFFDNPVAAVWPICHLHAAPHVWFSMYVLCWFLTDHVAAVQTAGSASVRRGA